MLWIIEGHRAALEWKPAAGRFVATVPAIPGIWAEGRSRGEALARLRQRLAQIEPGEAPDQAAAEAANQATDQAPGAANAGASARRDGAPSAARRRPSTTR